MSTQLSEALRSRIQALHTELQRREAAHIGSIRARWDSIVETVRSGGPIPDEVQELWRKGEAWKVILDEGQLKWTELWNQHQDSVFNGSGRQRGKSLWALSILDTAARKYSKERVRWTGLTIDTARNIVGQAGEDYWLTCPEALKPKRSGDDYVYPNGSTLFVVGTDAQTFRRARGMARIAVDVRDECGFYQEFQAVNSALTPGTQVPGPSKKSGRVLYSSTPSESPAHASNTVIRIHQARLAYICETFFQNPRVDPEVIIQQQMAETGLSRDQLLASTSFRREFLGELILEETLAAIPRWEQKRGLDKTKHELVAILPRPEYFNAYVALDLGGHVDPHMALFAIFDPATGVLYVEDELELASAKFTIAEFASAIKEKERDLYGLNAWDGTLAGADQWQKQFGLLPEYMRAAVSKSAPKQPLLRVGDNDNLALNTLMQDHKLAVVPSQKHDKVLHVDAFNNRVGRGQFMVHPRCTRLLTQLSTTTWNKARTSWERTSIDHGDAIDCAVFLERNVFWTYDGRPAPYVDPYLMGTQDHVVGRKAFLKLVGSQQKN